LGPHALHHGADLSDAVIDVFIDLHKKGLVYRGLRMVNWDPVALTAVSDEEVIHKEVNSKLVPHPLRVVGSPPSRSERGGFLGGGGVDHHRHHASGNDLG
jgi:hypothetical protein